MAGFMTQHRGNEFYTRCEDVDMMLTQYLPIFQRPGVRVLCPCDTHESAYVQFFREHGVDVTWSDELCFQQFDFGDFDFVITNPPFSLMQEFLRKVLDSNCEFRIVMPLPSIAHEVGLRLITERGAVVYDEGTPTKFERPGHAGTLGVRYAVVLASRALSTNRWRGSKRREKLTDEQAAACAEMTEEGLIRYSRAAAVPDKWVGDVVVPLTWLRSRYDAQRHQIVDIARCHRASDGKAYFASLIVRCRRDIGEKEE